MQPGVVAVAATPVAACAAARAAAATAYLSSCRYDLQNTLLIFQAATIIIKGNSITSNGITSLVQINRRCYARDHKRASHNSP